MDRLPSSRLSYKDFTKVGLVAMGLSMFTACEVSQVEPTPTFELPTPRPTLVVPNTPTPSPEPTDLKRLTVPLPIGCQLITDIKKASYILNKGFAPVKSQIDTDPLKEALELSNSGFATQTSEALDLAREEDKITEVESAKILITSLEKKAITNRTVAARSRGDMANQFNGQADCAQAQATSLRQSYDIR